MTANGVQELSIPIKKTGDKIKISAAKIDYQQKWVKDHWRTIRTAYGNAPFFEHFGGYFEEIYLQEHQYLLDLNTALLKLCYKLMGIKMPMEKTSDYLTNPAGNIVDFRSRIHPKKPSEIHQFYKPCNYNQIFGKKFVGNLSIIDLLFCEGPYAYQILLKSKP